MYRDVSSGMRSLIFEITNKKVTVAKLLNIVLATEKSRKMSQTSSDTEEDGNLSVEEVLTEEQEEIEEIAKTEVVNGGEPAGPHEGAPIVDEEWLG